MEQTLSKIEKVIDGFDFESVQQHMAEKNWKWYNNGKHDVPTVDDIKSTARYLLEKAYFDSSETSRVSTGGLVAAKFTWGLELYFAINSSFAS